MREFLRSKGFKMTPQRELIFRSFFQLGEHVSVDDLFERVHLVDPTIGYSTVWRNLKLICRIGLAEEVNLGDGINRYDRITQSPHGHLFCSTCRRPVEFEATALSDELLRIAALHDFSAETLKIEVIGVCQHCRERLTPTPAPNGFSAQPTGEPA